MLWKPGQSGNVKGRPLNTVIKEFREKLDESGEGALRVLLEKVNAGEDQALALFFRLWLAGTKPVTTPTPIPLKRNASIKDAADKVLRLTLAGEISPTIGEELMDAIQGHRMVTEFEDLKEMLEEWRASRKTKR